MSTSGAAASNDASSDVCDDSGENLDGKESLRTSEAEHAHEKPLPAVEGVEKTANEPKTSETEQTQDKPGPGDDAMSNEPKTSEAEHAQEKPLPAIPHK